MNRQTGKQGVSLAEVMIAMAGGVIIMGGLMVGSMALQRSFSASESFARYQADQRRLIDYVARDVRRAVGIATAAAGGVNVRVTTGALTLDENTALIITLPAYYRSHRAGAADYDQALAIVAAGDRVAYGTPSGPAPEFPVIFRKVFLAGERSMCFVREEGDTRLVIVRDAAELELQLTVAPDGLSCALTADFLSRYSREPRAVSVHDQVMLRNARID